MHADQDWFELCLDKYPDLPSVVLIRSVELKLFPRQFLKDPVLDLCCGDGFFAQALGLKAVCGCDIDREAVRRAGSLAETYSTAVRGDARDLSLFGEKRFHTVFANCAFEHVDGIDRALCSVARVLTRNGFLIMSVPDRSLNDWFFPAAACSRIGFRKYGQRLLSEYNRKQQHLNILSRSEWITKLSSSGFELEKSFCLFSKKEYQLITFFESFVLDSFPGNLFRSIYSFGKKRMHADTRRTLWRRLLKPVYLDARELESGGELFMVARRR